MDNSIETIDTKVTDKWGVHWNEMETVRDFLQNFYDANNINDIHIAIQDASVYVSAPAVFDPNELIYLGSDKLGDENTIGQYGEGFKASVLNALRNWNCGVEILIGSEKLRYYFKSMLIGKEEKRVVFCEKSKIKPIKGTQLIVSNCTKKIVEEFKFGLDYFYSESNRLFGGELASTYQRDIVVYKSLQPECGYVFYKKLLRCKIELPIVIVCNKAYQNVENKIKHDRDRKAFSDEVLELLVKRVFKNFRNFELRAFIEHVNFWWGKGNKMLGSIAETRAYHDRSGITFPSNFYAKESIPDEKEIAFEITKVLEELKKSEAICCPRYMSKFGMQTPDDMAEKRVKAKRNQLNKAYSRHLTILERKGINILAYFIKELSHELYRKFETAKYTVGDSDEVIGELKKKREFRNQHVFLNKIFFTLPFSDALAILLHEWAHIYGGDGSRSFSDALTHFIALILQSESTLTRLKSFEAEWTLVVDEIQVSRKTDREENGVYGLLDTFTNLQLKGLLKSIPRDDLFNLIELNKTASTNDD